MHFLELGRSQHVDSLVNIDLVVNAFTLIEEPHHTLGPRLVQPGVDKAIS